VLQRCSAVVVSVCMCCSSFVLTKLDVNIVPVTIRKQDDKVIVMEETADVNEVKSPSLFDPVLNILSCVNLREICNLDKNLLFLPDSLLSGCGGSDDDSRPRSNVSNTYAPSSSHNQRKICVL